MTLLPALPHRSGTDNAASRQALATLGIGIRGKVHHRAAGIATQLPWAQLLKQLLTDSVFAVINTGADLCCDKCHPFQQTLHIGIAVTDFGQVQHPGLLGMGFGKISGSLMQQPHFGFKILAHWLLPP